LKKGTPILYKTETHRVITIKLKVKDNAGAIDYYSYQIAIKRKPEYHFYVKDHLGNIRVTVNEQGEIVSKDDYYPFGLRMPGRSHTSGAGNDIYKFSGKELDDENGLGLYYFGARYYDSVIGRWGAVDPLAQKALNTNPFHYTHNNPLNRVDLDGNIDREVVKQGGKELLIGITGSVAVSVTIIKTKSPKVAAISAPF